MPQTLSPTCPLCGRVLAETDQLIAYYYPPRNWWVMSHVIRKENEIAEFYNIEGMKILIDNAYVHCHRAGFKEPTLL